MIILYLRIIFLILLCSPAVYIGILLMDYLIDEIVHKEEKGEKYKPYDYREDDIFQEYHRKKTRDFKVIR